MNRNPQRRTGIILAAAIAATSVFALVRPAEGQYPASNQNGHAQDANNRVGSGGSNGGHSSGSGVTGNDIVDRNVTGGRSFSGPLGERDPRSFTGPAPSGIDAFNRQSNAVNSDNLPINNGQPVPYYGDNRSTAPPSGSFAQGFNGGYIGTTINSPASLSSGFNSTPDYNGLQIRTLGRETLLINQALNSPDYANVNTEFNQSGTLTYSPIYGTQSISNGTSNFNSLPMSDQGADEMNVLRMRDELRQSINPNAAQQPQRSQDLNAQPPTGLNQPLNQPLGQAFDVPTNGAISSRTDSQLSSGQLSQTGIIAANASLLPPAAEQSALIATLQQRLALSGDVGKALAAAQAVPSGTAKPAGAQGGGVKSPNPAEAPVPVSHLADGIKAKGLHDLLAVAEDLIRQGKFDSSIQQYNQAFRVAPNNPLPILGRAHAELAGGYYARAEMDLRLIFRSDPELLLAQFDLKSLFPKDRLAFIHKDLTDLTQSDSKSERSWFLLAYLDYNSGDPAAAEKDLTQAEQLASRGDWTIQLLRQHWVLPSNPKPAPLTPRPATPVPPARAKAPAAVTPAPGVNK